MAQWGSTFFDAGDAFLVFEEQVFDPVQPLFDAIQSPVNGFEMFQDRSGYDRIQPAEQRSKDSGAADDDLPDLKCSQGFFPLPIASGFLLF